MDEKKISSAPAPKYVARNCESCEFYDYDEEWGEYVCSMSLDEDEMIDFLGGNTKGCPYWTSFSYIPIIVARTMHKKRRPTGRLFL